MPELVDLPLLCDETEPYACHQKVVAYMEQRGSRERDYLFGRDPTVGGILVIRSRRFEPHEGRVVPKLRTGQAANFVLRAVVLRRTKGGPRIPVRDQSGRLRWLDLQAKQHGFAVKAAIATGGARQMIRKGQPSLRNDVVFAGRLTVTDETAFANAMEAGIGREKAFGFGLMQISPKE